MINNLKVLIAPDSFKESLSAYEISLSMESGVKAIYENAICILNPLADGGEGTSKCIMDTDKSFKQIMVDTHNHLGVLIKSPVLYNKERQEVVIEAADSCGLTLINEEERNPFILTTIGLGEMILYALDLNPITIIIALGGTGTNDAGAGMLYSLGAKMYGINNEEIKPLPKDFNKINYIDISSLDKRISNTNFIILSDVNNILLGEEGATYIYGPQKGVKKRSIKVLEENINHFSSLAEKAFDKNVKNLLGSGAAGGLGFMFYLFNNTKMISGIEYIMELTNFDEKLKECDLVLTGEGSIDSQSINGKVLYGVINHAKRFNKPVIAFAGSIKGDISKLYELGVCCVFSIIQKPVPLKQLLKETNINIKDSVSTFMKTLDIGSKINKEDSV
jgi:glycerate kinase